MKRNFLFSIIIPTKNPNPSLFSDCINSIKRQMFLDYELIVIANGCDEQSIKQINDSISVISNSSLLINNQIGLSRARNYGLERAKGEYIVFLDDDDALSNDFLFIAFNQIKRHDCDLITFVDSSEYSILNESVDYKPIIFEKEEIKSIFLGNNKINKVCEIRSVWSKVFKKSIINEYDLKFVHNLPAEDIEFVLRYSFHSKKMVVIDKVGYFYRYRPESISHRCDSTIIDRFDLLHKTFDDDLTKNGIDLHYLYFHIINYSIYNIAISYLFHKENNLSIFKEASILRKLCITKYYHDAINTVKLNEMFTKKKKLILFLLKCHFYFAISILLSKRYKR